MELKTRPALGARSVQRVTRLDAIHHPDNHHDQSYDPENEPDRSTHFHLL